MKRHALFILLAAAGLGGFSTPAWAQSSPLPTLPRADVAGVAAWQNVDKTRVAGQSGNGWYNRGLYGGGAVGWYWSDHHKSEVELAASTGTRFRVYGAYPADNLTAYGTSQYTFRTKRIAINQQHQFFRNVWFHPLVGAGADITWETTTEALDAVIVYSQGTPRQVRPAQVNGPDTRVRVRPFAEVGFKSYVTPRAFFRSGLRVLVRNGIDEVQVRFGAGIDF